MTHVMAESAAASRWERAVSKRILARRFRAHRTIVSLRDYSAMILVMDAPTSNQTRSTAVRAAKPVPTRTVTLSDASPVGAARQASLTSATASAPTLEAM